MINKKLLITYLRIQRREYEKQVAILQKESDTPLSYINKQKYRTEKFLCDSMTTVIHVYTDLIEKVEDGKFSSMSDEDLEFYKATQEALDRYDDSNKGMSVEEFLKELDSW